MPELTFKEMRRIRKVNRFHADGNIKTCAIFGCGHNAPMMIDGQKLTLQLEHISQGVGHKSRMAMLAALMGRRALPAKELAYRAVSHLKPRVAICVCLKRRGLLDV